MSGAYLPDTDVWVDFLRGHAAATALVARLADRIIVSSIVVAELYAGVRGERERGTLDELFSVFTVAPVTAEIARDGGLLRNRFQRSHGTGLADALIAATAQHHEAALLTLNTKHFPMFEGLSPAYRKHGASS